MGYGGGKSYGDPQDPLLPKNRGLRGGIFQTFSLADQTTVSFEYYNIIGTNRHTTTARRTRRDGGARRIGSDERLARARGGAVEAVVRRRHGRLGRYGAGPAAPRADPGDARRASHQSQLLRPVRRLAGPLVRREGRQAAPPRDARRIHTVPHAGGEGARVDDHG